MSVSPDVGFQHEREPNSSAPPRLASRILERSTPEEEREFVLGDMAEEFEDRLQSGSGRARAGLWYWNQSVGHARRRLFQLLSAWLVRQRGTGGPGRLLPNWGRKRGDLMTDFMVDLKFAGRSFSRNPRFAAIVVFTLALGIGANTLIFSMINAVWLAPLPYGDPDAVVVVWGVNPELGVMMDQLSSLELAEFRARNQVFDGLAGHQYWDVNFTGVDEPRALIGYRVTGNLFDLLDVEPVVGRRFAASEKVPGGPNVVILSHRLWSALGSDSSIVGRQVRLNDVAHEVVGVMGAEFDYPKLRQFRGDLWVPVQLTEEQMLTGSGRGFIVIGRLRGGVTLEQAQADMDRVAMQLETERPETRAIGRRVTIERYGDQVMNMPGAAAVFLLLMVTVGFVLLIACAQRCQPAAGACLFAAWRNCDPSGARRRPGAVATTAFHREYSAGTPRWCGGSGARLLGRLVTGGLAPPGRHPDRHSWPADDRHENAGLYILRVAGHRGAVRPGPGMAHDGHGSSRCVERRRAASLGRCRPQPATQLAGG